MKPAAQENAVVRPHEVFISYSRKDKEFVRRLDEELKRREREAWVDWEGIRPTEEFMQAIYGAIEGADTFVFVLTPDSVASQICGRELTHAVTHNKRMIPLVAREVDAAAVPEPLAKLNWIFCRESDDLESATTALVSALDTDLEWVHAHTRLLTRAIEWETNKKSNSFVLRGEDLRSAEQWLAQAGTEKERQPTALQTEYIIASRKASSRRQRITLSAVSLGAVVALVLALIAWQQRSKAVEQSGRAIAEKDHSQQIASQADFVEATRLIAQSNTTRALAHLARALELWPANHAAADRLFTLFTQRRFQLPLTDPVTVKGRITSLRFTPAGNCLVVAVEGRSASLWEIGAKASRLTSVTCSYNVQDAQLSPDARFLATACGITQSEGSYSSTSEKRAGVAQIWDARNGHPVTGALQHSAVVRTVRFHPKGHQIITASDDGTAKIWSAESGQIIGQAFVLGGPALSAAFGPDGAQIVTVAGDVRLWTIATNLPLSLTTSVENAVPLRADFNPNGKTIAVVFESSSWDRPTHSDVTLFDCQTGKPVGEGSASSAPAFSNVAFDATGKDLLLSVAGLYRNKDSTGGVDMVDTATGKAGVSFGYDLPLNDAQFGANGGMVFFGGDDGQLHVRNRNEFYKEGADFAEPVQFGFPILRCQPQPGRHQLAVVLKDSSLQQNYVQLFETRTSVEHDERVLAPKVTERLAYMNITDGITLEKSQDGHALILGFEDGTARVAKNKTERTAGVRHGTGPGGAILTAKFGHDESVFATGGGADYRIGIGYARVWRTRDNLPLTELLPHDRAVIDLEFSSDGKRLMTLASRFPKDSGYVTRMWDVETGQPLSETKKDELALDGNYTALLADDSRRIVTVVRQEDNKPFARAWDAGFGRSAPAPAWLPRLAKLVGGYGLPEQGEVLQPILGRARELSELGRSIAASSLTDTYTRFAKWFFDHSAHRRLSPFASLTVSARIEACLAGGDVAIGDGDDFGLREAELLADGDSEILQRIALRRRKGK